MLLLSVAYAQGDKKLLKPDTQTKDLKVKIPAWMDKDEFTVTTIAGKKMHLLSTDKGFTFDDSKGKLTLLVVWERACKSCPKWLKGMQDLEKHFDNKVKVITLELSNSEKKRVEKLRKEKKLDSKALNKIIEKNHKDLKKFTKKYNLDLPIISLLSTKENLDFSLQTLYKFEFSKPRGKAKRGGGLPFTVVFGPEGQTAGITAGISDQDAYKKYIEKLIKYYEDKK